MTRHDTPLPERITARRFDDPEVRAMLDTFPESVIVNRFGPPESVVTYAVTGNWKVGAGHPTLASDDPAIRPSDGAPRAASSRFTLSGAHPRKCSWCPYPPPLLLEACDWATYMSRYIVTEVLIWRKGTDGPDRHVTYIRGGRSDVYENQAWAAFWALPVAARSARILAATYVTTDTQP